MQENGCQVKPLSFCLNPHFTLETGPKLSTLRAPPPVPTLVASPDLPEKSHLLVFLLIFADDLGGGDAHLHTVHHKPAGPLQGLVVQF